MALLAAREVSMRFFRPLLAEHELTEQQWRVLRALGSREGNDGEIDAGKIAAATCLLPPSLSRILDNLEGRNLIVRQSDPKDQRRALLTLSEAGRATVARVAPQSEARYEEIEAAFGNERLASLLAELGEFTTVVADYQAASAAEPNDAA